MMKVLKIYSSLKKENLMKYVKKFEAKHGHTEESDQWRKAILGVDKKTIVLVGR